MHLLPSTNAGVIPSLGSGLENLEDLDLEDGWCQIAQRKIGSTPCVLFGCLTHLSQAKTQVKSSP